tara:strand:- start:4773 stop:7397 length:2625 start_codon:yes stop_codon:yes gene_type:complete
MPKLTSYNASSKAGGAIQAGGRQRASAADFGSGAGLRQAGADMQAFAVKRKVVEDRSARVEINKAIVENQTAFFEDTKNLQKNAADGGAGHTDNVGAAFDNKFNLLNERFSNVSSENKQHLQLSVLQARQTSIKNATVYQSVLRGKKIVSDVNTSISLVENAVGSGDLETERANDQIREIIAASGLGATEQAIVLKEKMEKLYISELNGQVARDPSGTLDKLNDGHWDGLLSEEQILKGKDIAAGGVKKEIDKADQALILSHTKKLIDSNGVVDKSMVDAFEKAKSGSLKSELFLLRLQSSLAQQGLSPANRDALKKVSQTVPVTQVGLAEQVAAAKEIIRKSDISDPAKDAASKETEKELTKNHLSQELTNGNFDGVLEQLKSGDWDEQLNPTERKALILRAQRRETRAEVEDARDKKAATKAAADAAEIERKTKLTAQLIYGIRIPSNSEEKKLINTSFDNLDTALNNQDPPLTDDQKTQSLIAFVKVSKYLPKRLSNRLSTTATGGSPEKAAEALAHMRTISAIGGDVARQFSDRDKALIEGFSVAVDRGTKPIEAATNMIRNAQMTPQDKKARKAAFDSLLVDEKRAVDGALRGIVGSDLTTNTGPIRKDLEENLRIQHQLHGKIGGDLDDHMDAAIARTMQVWGATTVNGYKQVMRNGPASHYKNPGEDKKDAAVWIRKQMLDEVLDLVLKEGLIVGVDTKIGTEENDAAVKAYLDTPKNVVLRPSLTKNSQGGKPVYEILVKMRDGTVVQAAGSWAPDYRTSPTFLKRAGERKDAEAQATQAAQALRKEKSKGDNGFFPPLSGNPKAKPTRDMARSPRSGTKKVLDVSPRPADKIRKGFGSDILDQALKDTRPIRDRSRFMQKQRRGK